MRPLAFTTIAFLAGQHGFGIFVPYLGVFLVVAHLVRARRTRMTSIVDPSGFESVARTSIATA